jgi:hypothetical protein
MKALVRIWGTLGTVMLAGLALAATGSTAQAQVPAGWFAAGTHPREYDMVVDRATKHGGSASATVRFKADDSASGFGTLMQSFKADRFRGKRLRLTGYVKSLGVTEWAGLWVRVDGLEKSALAFDNMGDRKIEGTTDWKAYSIVLDVPDDAAVVAFGVLLTGKGQVWVDDLVFDVAGPDVAATNLGLEPQELPDDAKKYMKETVKFLSKDPKNLGCES